jgi:hypothetical protein
MPDLHAEYIHALIALGGVLCVYFGYACGWVQRGSSCKKPHMDEWTFTPPASGENAALIWKRSKP